MTAFAWRIFNIKSLYEDLTTLHAITIFWVIWVFVTVGAVLVFVVHENYWLEDKCDGKSRPFKRKTIAHMMKI